MAILVKTVRSASRRGDVRALLTLRSCKRLLLYHRVHGECDGHSQCRQEDTADVGSELGQSSLPNETELHLSFGGNTILNS